MTSDQLKQLESNLWQAADRLRVDSDLKASEYSTPVLGLIFLRFATIRYHRHKADIEAEYNALLGTRREKPIHEIALAKCGFYLPAEAEYDYLLGLPEDQEVDRAIKTAMECIEAYKPELKDTLPKDEYFRLTRGDDKSLPNTLLKIFANIPEDASGDVFGKVYEYFLSEFALTEGQGGGEFFTPTSVVRLMVEIIEPYKGTILDPACGSGGMFVQSSHFVDRRREELHETDTEDLMVYGVEKTNETVKLAKMNLAVNGLRGEIRQANSFYEDPFDAYERFDYVMANPPFNVDDVNLDRVKDQRRFSEFGIPQNKTKATGKQKGDTNTVPNANYLWINQFATALKPNGRAALVMANSASDARHSEADIRRKLIHSGVIDVMLTLPKNMFYTVTLPATLWFFDKSAQERAGQGAESRPIDQGENGPLFSLVAQRATNENNGPKILFIDARNIFRQVTRVLREFTDEHVQNIATIVRLYRGETHRLTELLAKYQIQADDFRQQADAMQPDVDNAIAAFEQAETTYRAAQQRLSLFDPQADGPAVQKTALAEVTRNNRDLSRAQRDRDELEKAQKALRDQQHVFEHHIQWLTERFPNGVYEDVTGLCKAATLDEIAEQDYSLNPGRYVGVVIEEDGLTEEEFLAEMRDRAAQLQTFGQRAVDLERTIEANLQALLQQPAGQKESPAMMPG